MEWFYNNKFLHFTLYVSIELFSHSKGIMPLSDDNLSVNDSLSVTGYIVIKIMFLQIIIQYYTTYQAVQLFCIKQEKMVANTHKHLLFRI